MKKEIHQANQSTLQIDNPMKNRTSHRRLVQGFAALTCSLALTACGSGWGPVFSTTSSSSGTVPVKIIDRAPRSGKLKARSTDEIRITFNKEIDFTTVGNPEASFNGSPSIRIFEEVPVPDGQGDYTNDVLPTMVKGIDVDGVTVTLHLHHPLRLLQKYYIRFIDDTIRTVKGQRFSKDNLAWEFTVRDGKYKPEGLVSFLQPMGSIRYLEDRSAAVVIEGRDFQNGNFVIGFSKSPPDGDFGIPKIIRDTSEETNQNGLVIFEEGTSTTLMSLAWQEGKPFASGNQEPKGDLWVSSSYDAGGSFLAQQIDQAASPSNGANRDKVSWPVQLQYNDMEDIVTAWWVFRETNTTTSAAFGEYDDFGVYTTIRDMLGWQPAQPIAAPPANRVFGWPFLVQGPGATVVYALWAEAVKPEDFFNDGLGEAQEILTSYWIGIYDSALGWFAQPIANMPGNLPRPSDFALSGNGRGVILAPSNDAGPRAFVIDLQATPPALVHESKYVDPSGQVLDHPDSKLNLPTGTGQSGGFGNIRSAVKTTFPRATPQSSTITSGDQTMLVSWKALSGGIFVNEYDVEGNIWQDAVCVIDEGPNSQLTQGPSLQLDQTGAITMAWVVKRTDPNNNNQVLDQLAKAARSKAAEGLGELMNNTFTLSDPLTNTCASGLNFDIHSTGRILFGWNNKDCFTTKFLASGFRKFQ